MKNILVNYLVTHYVSFSKVFTKKPIYKNLSALSDGNARTDQQLLWNFLAISITFTTYTEMI